jgi:hypothetical protein
MTNRYLTGKWAITRFSGKGIFAKAQSRKGAKPQRRREKKEMNMAENKIANIVVYAVYFIDISA